MNEPMTLAHARHYADKIAAWLLPHCERLEVAGSIRRERPVCNDIDLVIIPRTIPRYNLFHELVNTENQPWLFLKDYVIRENGRAQWKAGGEILPNGQDRKHCSLLLPKCQLDIWFTTKEHFASQLLCRTGSKEHNIWLAERAQAHGFQWKPYEGLFQAGRRQTAADEAGLYRLLGLELIEPKNRERDWIHENIEVTL